MNRDESLELLATGLNDYERRLFQRVLEEVTTEYADWSNPFGQSTRGEKRARDAFDLLSFLKNLLQQDLSRVLGLRKSQAEFTKRVSGATTRSERHRHILEFSGELGRTERQLRGDRNALSRWFGSDAVIDRFQRRRGGLEQKISFCLERLGVLADVVLKAEPTAEEQVDAWSRLDLESILTPFVTYDGDHRVCLGAFRCLSRALRALPSETQERTVRQTSLQFIYRSAMHQKQNVWLQCEALSLLESLSPTSFQKVLERRLTNVGDGDDLFVRRHAVKLLLRNIAKIPKLEELLPVVARDPSPYVRQGMAEALPVAPLDLASHWFGDLCRTDPSPQVRGAAVRSGIELLGGRERDRMVRQAINSVLEAEEDPFVLRVAMHVVREVARAEARGSKPVDRAWYGTLVQTLESLHTTAASLAVRRWAAQTRETIWCLFDPDAQSIIEILDPFVRELRPGERRRMPGRLLEPYGEDTVGRVLAVLSTNSFGYDVESRWRTKRITRGHVFGFRFWRCLYELKNASPDKRQAFPHTVGRLFRGRMSAPSRILSELAETKVPGEPLFVSDEGGWRPYLPLVDQVLSCVEQKWPAWPVKIYTSEGITELRPPRSPWGRLRAYTRLTWDFPSYARLRNWKEGSQESPAGYVKALKDIGFDVEFYAHAVERGGQTSLDPSVLRYFPAGVPLLTEDLWSRMCDYFVSVYDNSLLDLIVFSAVACGLFVGHHAYSTVTMRRARKRIPLVVGGWGTRGKSGTERIKAALFNALGYSIVSKTTGCEAMFLYAHPFGETKEMFLFRPYDKATIWEQRNVVRFAEKAGSQVFLWECMGLTPSYVEILQRHWMRDDLSTITNTYPDHEDLQGPAGFNIPEVMSVFIPEEGKVLTTEEEMLPILAEGARQVKTELKSITWLESGLLTEDVLKRFPYEEHPNNIALVLELADELGVDRSFAVKEMADRVVADLGVLKTYPTATVRRRSLEFTNGMSANERHGCLGNWTRLGFDKQDPYQEPGVWITTVVNNRADRVPRSRVFARILVEDISADRHFLIGGNLNGLVGYIGLAWQTYAQGISLWSSDGGDDPLETLRLMARRLRQPTEKAHLVARVRAALEGTEVLTERELDELGDDPPRLRDRLRAAGDRISVDEVMEHVEREEVLLREYEEMAQRIRSARPADRGRVNADFKSLLWTWFQRKLVVVDDYHISGDQLIDRIVRETPPGYLNRILGVQNIKGTGMDFVYRWQAWSACYEACEKLRDDRISVAENGLGALASFNEYGLVCEEHVRETIEYVKDAPIAQSESFQAEIAIIMSNLQIGMQQVHESLGGASQESGRFLTRVIEALEAFLDAGDAVRRRKVADQIYRDLLDERISVDRAILELQALIKRQKGGWLLKRIQELRKRWLKLLARLVAQMK